MNVSLTALALFGLDVRANLICFIINVCIPKLLWRKKKSHSTINRTDTPCTDLRPLFLLGPVNYFPLRLKL